MKIQGEGINRVALITDNTLSGIANAILAKRIFKKRSEVNLIPKNEADQVLSKLLYNSSERLPYKTILISGLKIHKILSDRIDVFEKEKNPSFRLFNNIKPLESEMKSWFIINEKENNSAKVFLNYFKNDYKLKYLSEYDDIINLLTSADDNKQESKDLYLLLRALGKFRFIERFSNDSKIEFSTDEKALITLEKEKAERFAYGIVESSGYIAEMNITNIGTVKVGIAYANNYINEVADAILNKYQNINLAIVINLPFGVTYKVRQDIQDTRLTNAIKQFRGTANKDTGNIMSKLNPLFNKQVASMLFKSYGAEMKLIKQ